jgi:hypothetical protein
MTATPEPISFCPVCDWEAIWLPAGAVACAEHGRFDEQGDALRDRQRDIWAREMQHDNDALLFLSTGPL